MPSINNRGPLMVPLTPPDGMMFDPYLASSKEIRDKCWRPFSAKTDWEQTHWEYEPTGYRMKVPSGRWLAQQMNNSLEAFTADVDDFGPPHRMDTVSNFMLSYRVKFYSPYW